MVSSRDAQWLAYAKREAYKSPCLHKHGCVITKSGKLLAKGYNHYYTNTGFSCHAEIDTLSKFDPSNHKRLKMFVVRVGPNGVKNSKPCEKCRHEVQKFRFRCVVFSNEEGHYTKTHPRDL